MNDDALKHALKACLSAADFPKTRQRAVLAKIKGDQKAMKKKISAVLAFALALSLIGGLALAAGLGLFGQLGENRLTEESGARLQRLEEAAEHIGVTLSAQAPAPAQTLSATDREKLLARQAGRKFELTVDQAYCDGNKLYYSYTLTTGDVQKDFCEGAPTGFDKWDVQYPGMSFSDVYPSAASEQYRKIADWMADHDGGFVQFDSFGLGDGVDLAGGTVLTILDSGMEWVDERTQRGYQEVRLPADAASGDTLDVVFSIHYGTRVIYQNDEGLYWAHIMQPESRGILQLPLTLPVNRRADALTGSAAFEAYSAKASLFVSAVDVSGEVQITAPASWSQSWWGEYNAADDYVSDYVLIADGVELPNRDSGIRTIDEETYALYLRYDLPNSVNDLSLCPVREQSGLNPEEALALK